MLSISVIVFFSVVLFAYWFRYSCLLILQGRTPSSVIPASGSNLNFPAVQRRLQHGERGLEALDQLQRDLTKDYRILCFLLRCSPETGLNPIERRMLMADYCIMRVWYGALRQAAPPQARKALEEMSKIVSCFAASVAPHQVRSNA